MYAKIISVCMEKGGVGKTTTSINLSAGLASAGKKVLLVDVDPQGDVVKALGKANDVRTTISNLLLSVIDIGECGNYSAAIIPARENLFLLPSNRKLAAVQNRLVSEKASEGLFDDDSSISSERVLKYLLNGFRQDYDYIILDCPPSLSMLTINALVASDSVLLPVESQVLSYDDVVETFETIVKIKKRYNPDLDIEGILLTKFQKSTNLSNAILDRTCNDYGRNMHIFSEPIPYSIRLAEQHGYGQSIFEYDPHGIGAKAYQNVVEEVIAHGK